MEAALAVIGLTAQLFQSAIDSYRFINTAQGLRKDAAVQFWKLRIQEVRLLTWGKQWGADRAAFEAFLEEEDLVIDVRGILTQIKELLGDSTKLKDKYGLKIDGFVEHDGGSRAGVKPNLAQKFLWSLKDKEKFGSLVADLKDLNDGLYCLMSARERNKVSRYAESEVLRLTEDAVECAEIHQACVEYRDEPNQKQYPTLPYNDLSLAMSAKQLVLEQAKQFLPPLGTSVATEISRKHERDGTLIHGYMKKSPTNLRVVAEYNQTPILLEWKVIDENNQYQPLIAQRMENLAILLAPESPKAQDFRVLDCLGYFRDTAAPRYGYLFRLPDFAVQQAPVTLYDVLSRGGPHEMLMDLGDRFQLARNLASSLLRLHECGWVHTSFRSDSILFFHANSSDQARLVIDRPYISSFGYSKPADPAESTVEFSHSNKLHDLYRHPEVIRSRGSPHLSDRIRLQQRHDLFSLGTVLLEVGLWEQLKALWKDKYTPSVFLDKLMTAYVPRLAHKMGTTYRDVVSDLLSMHIAQTTNVTDQVFFHSNPAKQVALQGHKGKSLKDLDWWSIVGRLEQCKA